MISRPQSPAKSRNARLSPARTYSPLHPVDPGGSHEKQCSRARYVFLRIVKCLESARQTPVEPVEPIVQPHYRYR